jgi:hypothetical protein
MRGYQKFRRDFEICIVKGVTNAYFIAREGSLTSPHAFLKFCDGFGLPYRRIDPPLSCLPCTTSTWAS